MLDIQTSKPAQGRKGSAGAQGAVTVREALGIFKNVRDLRGAIVELDDHFPRTAISVLGSRAEVEAEFGTPAVSLERIADVPHTPHAVPIRIEEKVIGNSVLIGGTGYLGAAAVAIAAGAMTIPAVITAVAIGAGTGAAVGGVLAQLLENHFNKDIEEQILRGGMLLWVHADDEAQEELACEILRRHGAEGVRVHTLKV
jgi:hypothetical protein